MQGKVKWFNDSKGFGFITSDEAKEDIFAHYSEIDMQGHKSLTEGEEVQFDLEKGPKGPKAVKIKRAT